MEKSGQNIRSCCASLDFLLSHVKSIEELDQVGTAIRDYEREYGVVFGDYRKEVEEMRRGFY